VNNETRSYVFEFDDDDANASIVETRESRSMRGKMGPPPSRDIQEELFQATLQGWEDQGLPNHGKFGKKGKEHTMDKVNDTMEKSSGVVRVAA